MWKQETYFLSTILTLWFSRAIFFLFPLLIFSYLVYTRIYCILFIILYDIISSKIWNWFNHINVKSALMLPPFEVYSIKFKSFLDGVKALWVKLYEGRLEIFAMWINGKSENNTISLVFNIVFDLWFARSAQDSN